MAWMVNVLIFRRSVPLKVLNILKQWKSSSNFYQARIPANTPTVLLTYQYRPHQSEVMRVQSLSVLIDKCFWEEMFCWCCEERGWGCRLVYLMLTELTDSLRGSLGGGGRWPLPTSLPGPVWGETNIPEQLAGQQRPPEKSRERKHGEEQERKKNGHFNSTSTTHT